MKTHIDHVIWDLDNTLYPNNPNTFEAFHTATAQAASELIDISFADALILSEESYKKYGFSMAIFVRKFGVNKRAMHALSQHYLDPTRFIYPCAETTALFSNSTKQHSLLTHGHTTWAHNALTHLGIRDCFEDHHIIGIEQLDFCLKDKSTKPFEYLLKKMDALPHKTAMVEDLPENLKFAKELGITTIHMVYDAEEPSPDWVDTRVSSPKELLKILA